MVVALTEFTEVLAPRSFKYSGSDLDQGRAIVTFAAVFLCWTGAVGARMGSMRIFLLSFLVSLLTVSAINAEALIYALDQDASRVGYQVAFGPDQITGVMPVQSANITLDFERTSNSHIDVVLDVVNSKANFPFATQALRGPKILDAERFPVISFVSTKIEVVPDAPSKARLSGNITIRDVTRPVTLDAELFRPAERALGERERLIVRLSGVISRAAFGADGWSDLVGDTVTLDLSLQIDLTE